MSSYQNHYTWRINPELIKYDNKGDLVDSISGFGKIQIIPFMTNGFKQVRLPAKSSLLVPYLGSKKTLSTDTVPIFLVHSVVLPGIYDSTEDNFRTDTQVIDMISKRQNSVYSLTRFNNAKLSHDYWEIQEKDRLFVQRGNSTDNQLEEGECLMIASPNSEHIRELVDKIGGIERILIEVE